MSGAATEDLCERIGSYHGGPEPVPSGRGRQVYLSPRTACRDHRGLYTPVLARQVTSLMGHMTSDETSKVFTELGISGPSSSSCDRLPKLLSAVWESHREHWEGALRQQEVVAAEAAVVAVSLDGVMVPDKDAQRLAKATREAAKSRDCPSRAVARQATGKWAVAP